jgi:hypothetical protein
VNDAGPENKDKAAASAQTPAKQPAAKQPAAKQPAAAERREPTVTEPATGGGGTTTPSGSKGKPRNPLATVFGFALREPTVMLVLSIVGFLIGWWLIPPDDSDVTIAAQPVVEAPATVQDAKGSVPLETVAWAETHDGEHQPQAVPRTKESPLPPLPAHSIRARIAVAFSRPVVNDVPVEINLDLPVPAIDVKCRGLTPGAGCLEAFSDSALRESFAPALRVPVYRIQVGGKVNAHASYIAFAIDVKGIDGLGFSTNRTRAKVSFPGVVMKSPTPSDAGQPLTIVTTAALPGAEKYSWTERPLGQNDNTAVWQYQASVSDSTGSKAPIAGVRDDVLRSDGRRDFWAGIAFGVAGAAVIGLIQSIYTAIREHGRNGGGGGAGTPGPKQPPI